MSKYINGKIVKGKVTGIEEYGAFVNLEEHYSGLVHISEISYGYVKNIIDFIKPGDEIYVKILDNNESDTKMKLSIKDIDYKTGEVLKTRIEETKSGFSPLEDNLEKWMSAKLDEI